MTTKPEVPEDLLHDVLERLEDLQQLRDEGEGVDWSQLRDFPVDYYEKGYNGIGGPADPNFDAGFHVGTIVTTARMLGLTVAELLEAAREHERRLGHCSSSGTRSTTGGYAEGPPPPVPLGDPPPDGQVANRTKTGGFGAARGKRLNGKEEERT